MQKRIIQAGLQGMNQDVINPNVNSKQAYEIKNFRLNATANSNAIELTTEKGTMRVPVEDMNGNPFSVPMFEENDYTVIGHCAVNEHLVIFMKGNGDNLDRVMHFVLSEREDGTPFFYEDDFGSYLGNLNFDTNHKIEAIPCYESEDVIKVYWIDGINYPRVINLKHNYGYTNDPDDVLDYDPFSFYQEISSGSYNTIDVLKTYVGGLFYAGVVQYAFSFYNRNAQETPIVYTTPLNYVSHSDRGEVANKQLGCAFKLTVKINPEDHDRFEYVRIYQIYRTSLNVTPVVKVIKDIKTDGFDDNTYYYSISFTDTNHEGFDFDAYRILVDSEHIKPNAITFKDQKLFLGNYSTDSNYVPKRFVENGSIVEWTVDSSKCVEGYDGNFYSHKQQTNLDSQIIKGFKYNEYYKFGLQFQDKYGKWTQPFIVDSQASQNNAHPVQVSISNNTVIELPYAKMKSQYNIGYIKGKLYGSFGYQQGQFVKVRPVVSFPTISERSVLCQGIVNPTVFNITQRTQGTCFSQASWFFRPFFISNNTSDFTKNTLSYKTQSQAINNGAYVQCMHFEPLFSSDDIGGELQNMYFDDNANITGVDPVRPYHSAIGISSSDAINKYHDFYYVDHSIMTLNSPDVDFNENIKNVDLGQYKINIVGYIPFVSNCSKQMIVAESPLFLKNQKYEEVNQKWLYDQSSKMAIGFNDSIWKKDKQGRIVSRKSWFDDVNGVFKYRYRNQSDYMIYSEGVTLGAKWNQESKQYLYNTYPFQRDYLNNYGRQKTAGFDRIIVDDIDSSKIIKKVLGNLKFSKQTTFYDNQGSVNVGDMKLFGSNENQLMQIGGKTYYGNVDQLVTTNSQYVDYVLNRKTVDPGDSTDNTIYFFADVTDDSDEHNPVAKGYPIIVGSGLYPGSSGDTENTVVDYYGLTTMTDTFDEWNEADGTVSPYGSGASVAESQYGQYYSIYARTPNTNSQDPVILRYKSTNHIVFSMPLSGNQQSLFPQPIKQGWSGSPYWSHNGESVTVPWNNGSMYYYAQGKTIDSNFDKIQQDQYDRYNEVLFMCDVYKDIDPSYLSNDDNFSNQQRSWIVCGDTYDLEDNDNTCVEFREGDTFFQRYDCLKTYPFSEEDKQSVVEIASFMVETKVNLDGRYDENRGLDDNTFISPVNFNLINPVYSQENNFFQYSILDENSYRNTKFPTRFTWSLNKINDQEIDEWTRTNTAAFYDCDGDKGAITSLRRFRNQIYAFQDRGISRIKYNENVAISAQNGTPIELANSQTVNGVEYISETVGSQNKWSNISTPNGIFFVDNYTPGIYRLGGGESVLSNLTKNCMQRWFESRNNVQDCFISDAWYDSNMNEVMFMFTDDDDTKKSVAFNCDYNVFSSFYDYKGRIGNINSHSFNIYRNNIHFLREGNTYNTFYGSGPSKYWISFVANAYVDGYSPSNAIYDNVWYKADVLHYYDDKDTFNYGELIPETDDKIYDFTKTTGWYETFNKIVVGNDYQYAENKDQTKGFDFIKKFRTWRVPVPRQTRENGLVGRERMRNSWLRVRLENTSPSYDKMVLRDIYVDSFY